MSGQRLPEHNWVSELYDDLIYLSAQHALTGLAEIVRERRRQIEVKCYTTDHDLTAHADGALMEMAAGALSALADQRLEGLADPATDQTALAEGAALAWAEIDRLAAEFGPQPQPQPEPEPEPEPAGYRCWTEGNYTHHAHKPGLPCPMYGSGD